MNLAHRAYQELYGKPCRKEVLLAYSGRFSAYNANIRMDARTITLSLSKHWKGVSPEIQKGLVQELYNRLFKTTAHSIHIDLYHTFIKSLPNTVPKTHTHPLLEERFEKLNEQFFSGMMERPNLKLSNGITKLGTYEYATDTICISKTLLNDLELLDYVLYHEMLHKKHQYKEGKRRTTHHSKAFREDEKKFPNAALLEKRLGTLAAKRPFWQHF